MVRGLRRRDAAVLLGGLVAVAATVGTFRSMPNVPTTAGFALLVVVLATATLGRIWIASVVAIVATGAFNFYFFEPVGTLAIADPQNWIAASAFLVAAVIASNLSAAAQVRAREAITRRNEVTRLFDLTRDVLLTTQAAGAIDALARHVARRFELSRIAICLPADDGWHVHQGGSPELRVDMDLLNIALARARGTLEFDAYRRTYGGHLRVKGEHGELLVVPLRHGTRIVGLLATVAPAVDVGALDAVAGVIAIAIERTQFLAEREAAELVRQKADVAATLLASLSHDLKTPLTAICVAVENLRGELERFFRGRKARQLSAGTGMGLALTRGLLNAIDGRIWGENAPGAGARFTLVVPGPRRRISARA